MALLISNPKTIVLPEDRVIRPASVVWLRPYFPTATGAQVEFVMYENDKDYIDQQLSDHIRGVFVRSMTFSLDELDFFNTLHTKATEELLAIDPTLQIEYKPFLGMTAPPIEPEVEPTPDPAP